MNRIVLIDRDGTINVERNYLSDPAQIELLPGAAEGIRLLRELGLPVVVVTNQSGIGRGYFNLKRLEEIHKRLQKALKEQGAKVDAIYFCPHTPEDQCGCRKPSTGMADKAAKDFNADLSKSFVIGDNVCDIEIGKNIGATTILVRTGHGSRTEEADRVKPDYTVNNIYDGVNIVENILKAC